MVG
ncbi:hypothetical protein D020_1378A, partial [Vibrio parahaemolyticus SBR10290]|jgi:elongation factor 1-alpha